MALIVDAGVLYSQADARDPNHRESVELFRAERDVLVTSEAAVAEADYLIGSRLGVEAELAFLDDLAEGTFLVECLTTAEIKVARDVARRFRDLRLGFSDASLVVLAGRFKSRRIATLDERAFRQVPPLNGGTFVVLPADAQRK